MLFVDHVDFDQKNNDPKNLVAACVACNANRSQQVADDEPHVVRANGNRLRGIARFCLHCGNGFVAVEADGRFCSRSCARKDGWTVRRLKREHGYGGKGTSQ